MRALLKCLILLAPAVYAASPVAKIYDDQVGSVEREVYGLANKMPADKYDFAPTNGTFTGVRTFALQVRHIATIMYQISAAVLNEKAPVDLGPTDNGPDNLKTKEQILAYFKGSIAYAHKAMNSITEQNMMEQVPSPFGRGTMPRLGAAAFLGLHSYDHYGQMVEYARMNNVVPGNPPPNGKGKQK
jgi:hypothetical protein